MTYTSSSGGREGFKWDWKHAGNMGWGTQAAGEHRRRPVGRHVR